jgi:hypothetical protein
VTGIVVEIFMKETAGIIAENAMKVLVIVADRDAVSRDGQPGGQA